MNGAIFLLNEFNFQQSLGRDSLDAVLEAIKIKGWPIVLTIISTCCGLLPFLMDGEDEAFWYSLAAGSIGGLIFSMIVIFLVIPVLLVKKEK